MNTLKRREQKRLQLYAVVYMKPKQLIIKYCARRFVLKLYRHKASHGLSAIAELLVNTVTKMTGYLLAVQYLYVRDVHLEGWEMHNGC